LITPPCDTAYTGRIIDNVAKYTPNKQKTIKPRRKWEGNIKMYIQEKMAV
jgi:hypothetical protein